jgi:hypothetical protein
VLIAVLFVASCTTPVPQSLSESCDAHECPSDPPEYINCMPIVSSEWAPVCESSCRSFLQQTCKIEFVD